MKRYLTVLIFLSFGYSLWGQGARYIIRNYDLLSEINLNGSTWAMVQDTNGILYFGADYGIAIYNGASWELASRNQSIVRSLLIDRKQRIIYGGFDDFGWIRPDPARGSVFESLADRLPDSLRVFGDIWSICETDEGIFFQSNNRIFLCKDSLIRSFEVSGSYHRGFVLGEDYVVNLAGQGLSRFDGTGFTPLPGAEWFADKIVSCLIRLSDQKVLIGCRQEGFYLYNPDNGQIADPFPDEPATNRLIAENKLYHSVSLPNGNLAVATLSGGTWLISPEGKILKRLNRSHGLRDNVNYYLGLSRDQNIWICTSNGISAFNIHSPFILWDYTSGIDGVVLDMIQYQDRILIGTLTGLYEIEGEEDGATIPNREVKCLLRSEVWSLGAIEVGDKTLLMIGTGAGLYQLDGNDLRQVSAGKLILKVMPLRTRPGTLLAFHADEVDVFRWNGKEFITDRSVSGLFNGMRTAAVDQQGSLWVGTRNGGVVHLDAAWLDQPFNPSSHKTGFGFDSLLTDVIDFKGQVIFTNRSGLFVYNRQTRQMEKSRIFGTEIESLGRMIPVLKQDSRGNIWIGGEDILMARPDGSYSLDKLNFQQLKDVFSAFVFLHTQDQKTWIGGNNGVYLFDNRMPVKQPGELRAIINRIEAEPGFTLYLNTSALDPGATGVPGMGKSGKLNIDLAKRNSQVTFFFSLPFFESERTTTYSHCLDGFTNEWSPWSTDPQITFSNLKPGDYHFQVKARNFFNQVSEPATIRFHVPTPWYLSGLMLAAYALVLATAIFLIAKGISRSSIRKHLRIEDVIRTRIQESNRANILNLLNAFPGQLPDKIALSVKAGEGKNRAAPTLSKESQFLIRAVKIMEIHMGNHELTAGLFCKELGMSQATVYRKLISSSGMSINQFIRNIRLKKAAQLLIETDLTISEIAYETGFSSPGYFTRCFTAEFGQNPRDFSHLKHFDRQS